VTRRGGCFHRLEGHFHIYYGLPSIGLAVWAGGALLVYRLSGRIIGLVIVHLLWEAMASGFIVGWPILGVSCGVLLLLPLLLGHPCESPVRPPSRPGHGGSSSDRRSHDGRPRVIRRQGPMLVWLFLLECGVIWVALRR